MSVLHVVFPDGIDDPGRPSGGNTYDRRMAAELAAAGWQMDEHAAPGAWPRPGPEALAGLARVLAAIPAGGLVLIDGLIAQAPPGIPPEHAERLSIVILVHAFLTDLDREADGDVDAEERRDAEAAALARAAAIVATSDWAKSELIDRFSVPDRTVDVVRPGVDTPAYGGSGIDAPGEPVHDGSPVQQNSGGTMLVVASVVAAKGHDVLVDALAEIAAESHRPWQCVCVGALDRDPEFVDRLRSTVDEKRLISRIRFTGTLTGSALEAEFNAADVLVLPSRAETYGMVVTEALARSIPVIASDVGGVPEALGYARTARTARPGILVRPADATALARALRNWLDDAALRSRLQRAAHGRRATLPGWPDAARRLADVLSSVRSKVPTGVPSNAASKSSRP